MYLVEQRHADAQDRTGFQNFSWFEIALALCVMTLLFAPYVISTAHRPLWHDELFTFYMGRFSTFGALIHQIQNIDFNPPLIYLTTRAAFSIFGDSEIATRLPDIFAFWVASASLLLFVARRIGAWYGLLAATVIWFSNSLSLATEAWPYALLLMFMGNRR